jgi:hypothetical protein
MAMPVIQNASRFGPTSRSTSHPIKAHQIAPVETFERLSSGTARMATASATWAVARRARRSRTTGGASRTKRVPLSSIGSPCSESSPHEPHWTSSATMTAAVAAANARNPTGSKA